VPACDWQYSQLALLPPCHAPAGIYSTERLRELFGERFLVEDVILKDSRKKKKASALVVLDSIQAAGRAAHEVMGELNNPLLVTPYLKVMPQAEQQQQQQQPAGVGGASPAGAGNSRRPAAPLFAAGADGDGGGVPGAGSAAGRAAQRPSKPLFPSKCLQPVCLQGSAAGIIEQRARILLTRLVNGRSFESATHLACQCQPVASFPSLQHQGHTLCD